MALHQTRLGSGSPDDLLEVDPDVQREIDHIVVNALMVKMQTEIHELLRQLIISVLVRTQENESIWWRF